MWFTDKQYEQSQETCQKVSFPTVHLLSPSLSFNLAMTVTSSSQLGDICVSKIFKEIMGENFKSAGPWQKKIAQRGQRVGKRESKEGKFGSGWWSKRLGTNKLSTGVGKCELVGIHSKCTCCFFHCSENSMPAQWSSDMTNFILESWKMNVQDSWFNTWV